MSRRLAIVGLLFGTAAFVPAPKAARADVTPPQSVSIGATDTNFGPGTANNDPLVFNQFNSSLGTLTAVNVTVSYDFIHTSTVTFYTPGTIGTMANSNVLTLRMPNGETIATGNAPDYASSTTFNSATMQLNQTLNLSPVTNSGTVGPISLTSSSDLSAFTGKGTIALPLLATSLASLPTNNGNGAASVTTKADAKVSISYDYKPPAVPEPSSLVLLGLGGCGVLWLRRRAA
jgi:hypothetical protein